MLERVGKRELDNDVVPAFGFVAFHAALQKRLGMQREDVGFRRARLVSNTRENKYGSDSRLFDRDRVDDFNGSYRTRFSSEPAFVEQKLRK
jgi:hypothetical protein